MTMPHDVRTVEGRVFDGNLRAALRTLGRVAGFRFGHDHWNAIATGLKGTDPGADRWYDYEFNGRQRVRLRCAAHPDKAVVFVRVEVSAGLEPQVQLLLAIFSRYRLRSKRRRRMVAPPELGLYSAGEIIELVSEEEKAGRPLPPVVYPVMPPDTPPDVLAAMRESGALPPLPAPEPPPG